MIPLMPAAILVAFAYLVGSIPFGVIVGRLKGVDPRTCGSGNIGATNVLRTLGVGPGLTVMLLDIAKGWLPVWLARSWHPDGAVLPPMAILAVGVAAILGHAFSVFLGFKGGKAVATGCGVYYALDWRVGAAITLVFVALIALTRYVSIASMLAAASAAVFFAWFHRGTAAFWPYVGVSTAAALFVVWKHSGNIKRLVAGTEARFGARP